MVTQGRRYAEFLRDVSPERILPVYLFTGSDDFLKREALRRLCRELFPSEDKPLNYESFLGGECDWSDVQAACLSSGLFAEKKLVALIGVELMSSRDVSGFREYVHKPNQNTCLVTMTCSFSEEYRKKGALSLRRILTALADLSGSYQFWLGNEADCKAWAQEWLKKKKKMMRERVLKELMGSLGHSCYEVWNVLEKAASLTGERTDITREDVASVGGAASLGTIEAFSEAVARGDRVAAHRNAAKCLEARDQATALLWRLNTSLRAALSAPGPPVRMRSRLRRDLVRDNFAQRLSTGEMCRAIAFLCETEKGIKRGALKPQLA
ncbi:MAG: DNA polymerase III subunit delta, partial [Candidatus Eiseniibacteriota bacterium]